MNLLVSLFGAIILAAVLLLGIGTGLLSNKETFDNFIADFHSNRFNNNCIKPIL